MARVRQARRCRAHRSSTGEPCRAFAMVGQRVCSAHGGRSPKARAAAERRVAVARAEVALARELARNAWEIHLWEQARRELAGRLLGKPADEIDRYDLAWANVRFGRPALEDQRPGPRWRRAS